MARLTPEEIEARDRARRQRLAEDRAWSGVRANDVPPPRPVKNSALAGMLAGALGLLVTGASILLSGEVPETHTSRYAPMTHDDAPLTGAGADVMALLFLGGGSVLLVVPFVLWRQRRADQAMQDAVDAL